MKYAHSFIYILLELIQNLTSECGRAIPGPRKALRLIHANLTKKRLTGIYCTFTRVRVDVAVTADNIHQVGWNQKYKKYLFTTRGCEREQNGQQHCMEQNTMHVSIRNLYKSMDLHYPKINNMAVLGS